MVGEGYFSRIIAIKGSSQREVTLTTMFMALAESVKESAIRDTYLKRYVQPAEIAKAVFYLASDDANSVTGQVLVVDCGYSLK